MRNRRGVKTGSLTPAECFGKASKIIADKGMCLFLIDLRHQEHETQRTKDMHMLVEFTREVTQVFADEFPTNTLAVTDRPEKGFEYCLGDAFWVGISDAATINRIIDFKNESYPDLPLHYGVAADGWSEGIELVK